MESLIVGNDVSRSLLEHQTGACSDPDDVDHFVNKGGFFDFDAQMRVCTVSSFNNETVAACLKEEGMPYPFDCRVCFGQLGVCTAQFCLASCGLDDQGQLCADCAQENCAPDFFSCAGDGMNITACPQCTREDELPYELYGAVGLGLILALIFIWYCCCRSNNNPDEEDVLYDDMKLETEKYVPTTRASVDDGSRIHGTDVLQQQVRSRLATGTTASGSIGTSRPSSNHVSKTSSNPMNKHNTTSRRNVPKKASNFDGTTRNSSKQYDKDGYESVVIPSTDSEWPTFDGVPLNQKSSRNVSKRPSKQSFANFAETIISAPGPRPAPARRVSESSDWTPDPDEPVV